MNNIRHILFVVLLSIVFLAACSKGSPDECIPPSGFSKEDLVGTWRSVSAPPGSSDVLIIRGDGTYKQLIHLESGGTSPFDYESDWQLWHIEYVTNGQPYLYLDNMRLCAYGGEPADCNVMGGGKSATWYDFCKKMWISMPDGGILIITGPPGTSNNTPVTSAELSLVLLQKGEDVWGYRRTETQVSTPKAASRP